MHETCALPQFSDLFQILCLHIHLWEMPCSYSQVCSYLCRAPRVSHRCADSQVEGGQIGKYCYIRTHDLIVTRARERRCAYKKLLITSRRKRGRRGGGWQRYYSAIKSISRKTTYLFRLFPPSRYCYSNRWVGRSDRYCYVIEKTVFPLRNSVLRSIIYNLSSLLFAIIYHFYLYFNIIIIYIFYLNFSFIEVVEIDSF